MGLNCAHTMRGQIRLQGWALPQASSGGILLERGVALVRPIIPKLRKNFELIRKKFFYGKARKIFSDKIRIYLNLFGARGQAQSKF